MFSFHLIYLIRRMTYAKIALLNSRTCQKLSRAVDVVKSSTAQMHAKRIHGKSTTKEYAERVSAISGSGCEKTVCSHPSSPLFPLPSSSPPLPLSSRPPYLLPTSNSFCSFLMFCFHLTAASSSGLNNLLVVRHLGAVLSSSYWPAMKADPGVSPPPSPLSPLFPLLLLLSLSLPRNH